MVKTLKSDKDSNLRIATFLPDPTALRRHLPMVKHSSDGQFFFPRLDTASNKEVTRT